MLHMNSLPVSLSLLKDCTVKVDCMEGAKTPSCELTYAANLSDKDDVEITIPIKSMLNSI